VVKSLEAKSDIMLSASKEVMAHLQADKQFAYEESRKLLNNLAEHSKDLVRLTLEVSAKTTEAVEEINNAMTAASHQAQGLITGIKKQAMEVRTGEAEKKFEKMMASEGSIQAHIRELDSEMKQIQERIDTQFIEAAKQGVLVEQAEDTAEILQDRLESENEMLAKSEELYRNCVSAKQDLQAKMRQWCIDNRMSWEHAKFMLDLTNKINKANDALGVYMRLQEVDSERCVLGIKDAVESFKKSFHHEDRMPACDAYDACLQLAKKLPNECPDPQFNPHGSLTDFALLWRDLPPRWLGEVEKGKTDL